MYACMFLNSCSAPFPLIWAMIRCYRKHRLLIIKSNCVYMYKSMNVDTLSGAYILHIVLCYCILCMPWVFHSCVSAISFKCYLWAFLFCANRELNGQLIERVATEFNKLQFYVGKCRGMPLVEEIKPVISESLTVCFEKNVCKLVCNLEPSYKV